MSKSMGSGDLAKLSLILNDILSLKNALKAVSDPGPIEVSIHTSFGDMARFSVNDSESKEYLRGIIERLVEESKNRIKKKYKIEVR